MPDGLDPSHDWHQFEEGEPPENLFCHRCEICTCHSPEASRERCDFAEYANPEPTVSEDDRG